MALIKGTIPVVDEYLIKAVKYALDQLGIHPDTLPQKKRRTSLDGVGYGGDETTVTVFNNDTVKLHKNQFVEMNTYFIDYEKHPVRFLSATSDWSGGGIPIVLLKQDLEPGEVGTAIARGITTLEVDLDALSSQSSAWNIDFSTGFINRGPMGTPVISRKLKNVGGSMKWSVTINLDDIEISRLTQSCILVKSRSYYDLVFLPMESECEEDSIMTLVNDGTGVIFAIPWQCYSYEYYDRVIYEDAVSVAYLPESKLQVFRVSGPDYRIPHLNCDRLTYSEFRAPFRVHPIERTKGRITKVRVMGGSTDVVGRVQDQEVELDGYDIYIWLKITAQNSVYTASVEFGSHPDNYDTAVRLATVVGPMERLVQCHYGEIRWKEWLIIPEYMGGRLTL